MDLQQDTSALDQTVQSWGFATVRDFAREQAKNILSQKIAYYQSQVDLFEQKYGLVYGAFCDQFDSLRKFTILDKEDDSIRWETALDAIDLYRAELALLII